MCTNLHENKQALLLKVICFSFKLGKGIPNERMQANNKACLLPTQNLLPSKEQAVALYESEGGNITLPELFGVDPIYENPRLKKLRFDSFVAAYPNFSAIFHGIVNGESNLFKEGLQHFVSLTTNQH